MPELDSIRGIAILMVVAYHAFFWSNQNTGLSGYRRLLFSATQAGWLGVDLFFVLSGFLISGLLIDAKQSTAKQFYVSFYARRALRILPLYYVVLISAGTLLLIANDVSFGFLWLSGIYLSNVGVWLGYKAEYPLIVLWSLAVEEQFYLIWPALIKLVSFNCSFWAVILLCLIEPIIRAASFVHWGFVDRGAFILTWYRLDSFAWGACLAFFLRSSLFTPLRFRILILVLIVTSIAMVVIGFPYGITTRSRTLGISLQFSCAAMFFTGIMGVGLLIGSRSGPLAKLLTPVWLRHVGKISYCLYLIHQLCFWSYDKLVNQFSFEKGFRQSYPLLGICVRAFVVGSSAIFISELSRKYFESHFLKMKSRFAF